MNIAIRFVQMQLEDIKRKGGKQEFVSKDGQFLSFEDALTELRSMQERGFECVPCCNNYDEKGRCAGHDKTD
jgi:hypothetical protein